MNRYAYPFVFAALLLPAIASAQPSGSESGQGRGQRFAERFKKADTNGDGKLTRAEAEAGGMRMVARNFDAIDTNKDGFVTPDEIRRAMEMRREQKASAGGASGAAPK
jgi:Ca2+-binding EF-hand superfamily protein